MAQGKIVGVLPVRLQSRRLPRKHIQEVEGKPLLEWSLRRYIYWAKRYSLPLEFVVATTDEPENEILKSVCAATGAHFFVGDATNIPKRLLEAANKFDAIGIVNIDGDDIACSPFAVGAVASMLQLGTPYVATKGLPFGMNALGFLRSELATCLKKIDNGVLETGWGRIFNAPTLIEMNLDLSPLDDKEREQIRLTLDYEQDLQFFQALIKESQGKFITNNDRDLMKIVIRKKLYQLNGAVQEEYWRNFRAEIEKEKRTPCSTP